MQYKKEWNYFNKKIETRAETNNNKKSTIIKNNLDFKMMS